MFVFTIYLLCVYLCNHVRRYVLYNFRLGHNIVVLLFDIHGGFPNILEELPAFRVTILGGHLMVHICTYQKLNAEINIVFTDLKHFLDGVENFGYFFYIVIFFEIFQNI